MGFLVANMESSELDFGSIQQPHCTVIDAAGREVLRYFMPEAGDEDVLSMRIAWQDRKSSSGQQGLVMRRRPVVLGNARSRLTRARIFWNQFLERWSFQARLHGSLSQARLVRRLGTTAQAALGRLLLKTCWEP